MTVINDNAFVVADRNNNSCDDLANATEQCNELLRQERNQYRTRDYISDVTPTMMMMKIMMKTTNDAGALAIARRGSSGGSSKSSSKENETNVRFVCSNDDSNEENDNGRQQQPNSVAATTPDTARRCSSTILNNHSVDSSISMFKSLCSLSSIAHHKSLIAKQKAVDWRSKICEWMYKVVDHFELNRDLVYVAMNYVDRYCSGIAATAAADATKPEQKEDTLITKNTTILDVLQDTRNYQLLAMASICLTIKFNHALDEPSSSSSSWVEGMILQLGRDNYTLQQLQSMESIVVKRIQLSCFQQPPTPQLFVTHFLKLFSTSIKNKKYINGSAVERGGGRRRVSMSNRAIVGARRRIEELALYILELSVHDYYFAHFEASIIAFTSLKYATEKIIDTTTADEEENDVYTDYNQRELSSSHSSIQSTTKYWLADLQRYLQRYDHHHHHHDGSTTNNGSSNYDNVEVKVDKCMCRLIKLFASSGTKLEDFFD